jgi:small subunit ribosomal protein S21
MRVSPIAKRPPNTASFNQHNPTDMPVEIKIRKGETMDKALRRLKKKLERESIIKDVRAKRYFEKPCEVRRRKKKVQAFTNMLRQRYENL